MNQMPPPLVSKNRFDPTCDLAFENAKVFYNLLCDIRQKGGTLPGSTKNVVFLTLTELAADHYAAILKLVETRTLVSSALALVRTLIETVGRAIWVHRRAKEQKLKYTIKTTGRDLPDYAAVSLAVDEEIAALGAEGAWFSMSSAHREELHSLTHSGKAALGMRIGPDGNVAPTYPVKTVHELLRRTASFAALNGIIHAQVMAGCWREASVDAEVIADRYQELFGHDELQNQQTNTNE